MTKKIKIKNSQRTSEVISKLLRFPNDRKKSGKFVCNFLFAPPPTTLILISCILCFTYRKKTHGRMTSPKLLTWQTLTLPNKYRMSQIFTFFSVVSRDSCDNKNSTKWVHKMGGKNRNIMLQFVLLPFLSTTNRIQFFHSFM